MPADQDQKHNLKPQQNLDRDDSESLSRTLVITRIRATDVAIPLRRIPVVFYVSVRVDDGEWRTTNKPIAVDASIIEWNVGIPLPLAHSANVHLRIGASFEFAPVLSNGTALCELDVSVRELLDRSEDTLPFSFPPREGELMSLCSSLLVTVERGIFDESMEAVRVSDVDVVTRRLSSITDDGHDALSRYRQDQTPADLASAIEHFTHAVDLCPPDRPCYPVVLFNLAVVQHIRCQVSSGADLDVEVDISVTLFRDVLELRPGGHPDRPATMFHLAVALLSRFYKRGDQADANEARELLSQVLESCPAESYLHRSARFALEMSVVDSVVKPSSAKPTTTGNVHDVAQSTSNPDPAETEDIGNTALFHLGHFEELGQMADLDRAISLLNAVVQLVQDSDAIKVYWLLQQARSYSIRFDCLDQLSDLSKSISTIEDALPLCRDDRTKAGFLNNLGHQLRRRFHRLGNLADVEMSVSALEDAVRLTPDGPHTDKPNMLGNLSASLRSRYDRLGTLADIDRSISVAEDALRRIPGHHPNKVRTLNALGASLQTRFERLGDLSDVQRSIAVLEDAMRLVPDGDPDKATCLNDLSGALLGRFQRLGDLSDIHMSVSALEESVQLTPEDHPHKDSRQSNLGYTLSARFQRLGDVADINRAVTLLKDASRRTPESDPSKVNVLGNLSRALVDRFQRLGDVEDIDSAVAVFEDVVRLTPNDHLLARIHLGSLSECLYRRFELLSDPADLQKAISVLEEALAHTPAGHPEEAKGLCSLGGLLIDCFNLSGDAAYINRAVSTLEEALPHVPDGHADKPAMFSNLCSALSIRCGGMGDVADTKKAIAYCEDALRLLPEDHPYKPGFLANFGNCSLLRFKCLGDKADLDKAIHALEEAVRRTPDEDPRKAYRMTILGSTYIERFTAFGDTSALSSAHAHMSLAARSSAGSSDVRFIASQGWIVTAQVLEDDVLDAYETAIFLLPQLAWIGLPIQDRHRALLWPASVTSHAAAAAIEYCQTQTAVEWLEQGRSIIWGQLLQLRTPLDDLRETYPVLAERLMRVSRELEIVCTRDPIAHLGMTGDLDIASPERQARHHRALAKERDDIVAEIRSSPGFKRFLLPKTFAQIATAVHSGPVVILNASQQRCDALVVTANPDSPLHVPLSDITFVEVVALQSMLQTILKDAGRLISEPEPDRAARLMSNRLSTDGTFKQILSELWGKVVFPVLERLGCSTPGELRRIFWCPTGPFAFLPIHAAGIYDTNAPGTKASDFVISSYTPTLDALMLPPEGHLAPTNLRILAIPQPDSDGQTRLPGTREEIAHIQAAVDSLTSPNITLLHSTGTVDNVLAQMPGANWVHFACHGIQDRHAPLDSGLMLASGRRLRLADIIRLSGRPRGGLAFLSACQTATGDRALTEEAVHLAAGMLLAGYQSVVATMWSIGDGDAPEVARSVYEQLFEPSTKEGQGEGGVPDARGAAQALHIAVARLRARGAPFMSWVPFIHVGL